MEAARLKAPWDCQCGACLLIRNDDELRGILFRMLGRKKIVISPYKLADIGPGMKDKHLR